MITVLRNVEDREMWPSEAMIMMVILPAATHGIVILVSKLRLGCSLYIRTLRL